MQITITEALSQLKNLNARITKEVNGGQFISTFQTGKVPVGYKSVDEFIAKAKSSYQSITDLIERKNKIKSAIVASNATTDVSIAGKTYTVAGAIERKSSIQHQKSLLNVLVQQTNYVTKDYERKSQDVQDRLDRLLEQSLGKDAKSNPDDVKSITDNFLSRNQFILCNPLDTISLTEKLGNEIEDFLGNVDTSLSISNATTLIEV